MNNEFLLYEPFIKEIKELIYRHQYEAMKKVNIELMQLYWRIGEEIYHKQCEKGWGNSVVEILSEELQKEFPGVQGFSTRNLWLMRSFYIEYTQNTFLQPSAAELDDGNSSVNLQPMVADLEKVNLPPLVAEISWTKNIVIIQKCKEQLKREFYIKMTKRFGWTKEVLVNNIENQAFEKYMINQTNFDKTVPEKYRLQAKLAVKDDYNYDFIEMGVEHSETELRRGLAGNIQAFLTEMGSGLYTFVGESFHIDAADEDSYIDVLLFHRQLQSLIAIELKIGEFQPEYAGKMQYYLAALDEKVKMPNENPSIGIIICKSKNRTKVEYTLRSSTAPIGVATYSLSTKLPANMEKLLPSPDEIARIVEKISLIENNDE